MSLRAMLITAGFGTRLHPLTDLLPKPAVPIANRPAAWFALDLLARAGICDVVLNTHHLARELEQALTAVAPRSQQLRFVYEPKILGTGGGVKNAWQPRAGETFLVMNGKYVFAPDLAAAHALHVAGGAFATMLVKQVGPDDPTGVVLVDDAGVVRGVPGHPAAVSGLRHCLYTGVSLLSAAVHPELPDEGCLIRQGYARWLAAGARVLAHIEPGPWRDVGMSLWHYQEANLALATGGAAWPGITPLEGGLLIAEGAQLAADVALRHSVIGAGARLGPGTQLTRCVVWPGAHVSGAHRDEVLLPDGRAVPVPQR